MYDRSDYELLQYHTRALRDLLYGMEARGLPHVEGKNAETLRKMYHQMNWALKDLDIVAKAAIDAASPEGLCYTVEFPPIPTDARH